MVSFREFFESMFDRLQSGVILIDLKGNIADINRFALTLFGIDKNGWVGTSVTAMFPALNMDVVQQSLTEQITLSLGKLLFQINGKELYLKAEVSPLVMLNQTVGIMLTFQDLTESYRIQQDIVEAEKMAAIGNMAAGTVHEIRNPLTTVKGFLQLLQRDIQKMSGIGLLQRNFSDKCQNVFPLLFSEIEKIEQILSNFLLISKPQELRFKVIRVNDWLHEIMPRLQQEALLHSARILCEFPRKNFKFFGDINEINSLLFNLVQNALEAVAVEGGEIHLSVESFGDSFRLSVRDNGVGISSELMSNVFDPFTTTKPERLGLGLSICRQIVTRMGGSISIQSETGKGTVVQTVIPCLQDEILSLEEMRLGLKEAAKR
ncbi:two-component system sensor histidine kinase NtrB [Effusibacillus dendaii]|uniref:histidine kinase n=1 Tax=Effusibacillus dendaii TaxID=2743772 RepID=A0A7I8DFL1_9BACL|nr:ATP-binding protein [Effusibacillus dendaii]BCJ88102.1 sporulation kinase C [Effusibacillus dendaii]